MRIDLSDATNLSIFKSLDPQLQRVVNALNNDYAGVNFNYKFKLTSGFRDKAAQDAAIVVAKSLGYAYAQWPNSAHNDFPSAAFDFNIWDSKGNKVTDNHDKALGHAYILTVASKLKPAIKLNAMLPNDPIHIQLSTRLHKQSSSTTKSLSEAELKAKLAGLKLPITKVTGNYSVSSKGMAIVKYIENPSLYKEEQECTDLNTYPGGKYSKFYKDEGGWDLGYGVRYATESEVTKAGFSLSKKYTFAEINTLFSKNVITFENELNAKMPPNKYSQEAYDALFCMYWNLRANIFGGSFWNAITTYNISKAVELWVTFNKAGGVAKAGLTARRRMESLLFQYHVYPDYVTSLKTSIGTKNQDIINSYNNFIGSASGVSSSSNYDGSNGGSMSTSTDSFSPGGYSDAYYKFVD